MSSIAWSHDDRIAVIDPDDAVRVHDLHRGTVTTVATFDRDTAWSLAWHPDSAQLAIGTDRPEVLVVGGGRASYAVEATPIDLAWSSNGVLAVAGEEDVVEVLADPPVRLDHSGETPCAVAWSPDGRRLATGTRNRIRIWDTMTWQLAVPALASPATVLAWRPDGAELASGNDDLRLQIWSPTSGILLRSFPEQAEIWSLQWFPDNRTVALFGFTGDPYRAWLRDTGSDHRHELPELTDLSIINAAWSPDGSRVAVVDDADTLHIVARPHRRTARCRTSHLPS